MLHLCSHGSFSCCLGLIVALFIWVLIVLLHVALDWLWHCLSVFSWFFLMLHWIDCDIVYLCSHGFTHVALNWLWHCLSVFLWIFLMLPLMIVTLIICVLMILPYVALDWVWHCLSVLSWFFLMLPWIDLWHCYLCSYGSYPCCLGLIVVLFICVLMVLPHVALDWLWHCLSVFSSLFLLLHWIDWDIVYLCSQVSSSFCLGLILTLFICVLRVLSHIPFD